jgi:hypothetical protein|tara:strand:- start:5262 stop:8033 length:2772 start_codon:yes stop_codon:yes gene_type:complete
MASTQLSPGVVVLERDLTNVVNATVDNVAAIVGSFEKGPVEQITSITSERELLAIFGRPNEYNYEYWFSAAQFLLYGGTLKCIRAANAALKNAIDTAQFTVSTFSAADTVLTVSAATDFDVNDLLLIDAEILTIQSVSGNDVTVARGTLSTSAASHAAAAPVTLIEPAATASTINEGATFTDSDTTLTVTSATTLAAGTNSYIRVDNEILRVTGVAGNDLTVSRAQLGTTAAAHTDGSAVTLQTVTDNKTTINELTATGITAPLIKNLNEYETTVESASNNWKWAASSPGIHGNSLRVVVTDAGADQIGYLAQPTSAEWEFTAGAEVSFSAANIYGKVYGYSVVATLKDDATLVGSWADDNFFTANSGNVTGRVVAYNPETRELEITIDGTSSDVLEINDTLTELANSGGSAGSATGDSAVIESISRRLRISLNAGSPRFQANQTLTDDNAATITIAAVGDEYEDRRYGLNQRWINIAPRPTSSSWVSERGGRNDLMHVLVLDGDGKITGTPGALLEKFLNVSKASDARSPQGDNIYYKDVIKNTSQYIYWGSHETNNIFDRDSNSNDSFGLSGINREFDLIKADGAIASIDDPSNINPLSVNVVGTKQNASVVYSLQGGVDGYTVDRPNILAGYDLISDAETEEVDYILMGPSMSTMADTIAKAQHIITIANTRKDCIAYISPYRADVIGQPSTLQIVERTVNFFDQLTSTSYAVFDNNYKYIYDKYNDAYRYIPCNADVAGLTLSTTLNQEPWFSPAGFNRGQLRNAIKLAYSPLKDHRDRLYASRVNPIVAFPGQGIVLFGDKTALAFQSAFDRINVRRLFLVIEEAIAEAAKTQLFELNDEFTRQSFKNVVEPYLRSVQSRRGILDFLVVCDGTNNPAESIDRGEFYAEIFVKPTRSINFITLTFTATRTGASFTEITT